ILSGHPAHALRQHAINESGHRTVIGNAEALAFDVLEALHVFLTDDAEANLAIGRCDLQPLRAAVGEDGCYHRYATVHADVGTIHRFAATEFDGPGKLAGR